MGKIDTEFDHPVGGAFIEVEHRVGKEQAALVGCQAKDEPPFLRQRIRIRRFQNGMCEPARCCPVSPARAAPAPAAALINTG